jgi:hypothetical protein
VACLAESINQLRRGQLNPRIATGIGYLSGILLRALEQGPVEERLAKSLGKSFFDFLMVQENRWWSVKLQSLGSKEHFLRYAGRYARRSPIAQRRITGISKQEITFWAKDRRLRRQVIVRLTPKEFLAAWTQHIPERYEHAVRSFGLFAPRAIGTSSAAMFTILGQSPKPRPKPLHWNSSIKRDFGWDPLIDRQGNRMPWNRRIASTKP